MGVADRVEVQVEHEQREFPKLDYSAKQIVGRIIRLDHLFRDQFDGVTATFGIKPAEFGILTVLRSEGAPYALAPNAINQRRFNTLSSGGMTNILHDLEKRGLVERLPDPSDGRGVLIRLTPRALGMIDTVIEARVTQEHRWIAALDSRERATLEGLLRKLLTSLEPVSGSLHDAAPPARAGGASRRRPVARRSGRRSSRGAS